MGKPRANIPTLNRNFVTTTCIDTEYVSRNQQPLIPTTASSSHHFMNHSSGSRLTNVHYQSCIPSFSFPSTSNTFGTNTQSSTPSWPSIPWPVSFCGTPTRPLPEGKERAQLWKKLSPADQDDLLYDRVEFYELKAKYDALELASVETVPEPSTNSPVVVEDVEVELPSVEDNLPSEDIKIDPPLEHVSAPLIQEELPDFEETLPSSSKITHEDTRSNILEYEHESAVPISTVSCDTNGSNVANTHHGLLSDIHYHYSDNCQPVCEDFDDSSVLYNYKKRRRRW